MSNIKVVYPINKSDSPVEVYAYYYECPQCAKYKILVYHNYCPECGVKVNFPERSKINQLTG